VRESVAVEGQDGLDELGPMPKLRKLEVRGYSGKLKDLTALGRYPTLRELSTSLELNLADLAVHAPELELLACDPESLEGLDRLTKLTSFTIHACFADGKLPAFTAPPLLAGIGVGCSELRDVSALAHVPQLEEVYLDNTAVEALAPLGKLKALRRLDLSFTPVKNLAPLAGAKSLEWLDVHNTRVASLAPLAALPRLTWVDAAPCEVAEVASLAASPALEYLSLAGTKVTDVRPLGRIKTLKELMVPKRCGRADVTALHRARPDMHIMAWVEKSESEDPSCF
jgi:internalin A